eukprot:1378980-Amorphochlora_amoeboformis.AAC.2
MPKSQERKRTQAEREEKGRKERVCANNPTNTYCQHPYKSTIGTILRICILNPVRTACREGEYDVYKGIALGFDDLPDELSKNDTLYNHAVINLKSGYVHLNKTSSI